MRFKAFLAATVLSLSGYGQIVFAATQAAQKIVQQEIQQTANPQEVSKTILQVFLSKSDLSKQLPLILMLLKHSLSKEKQPLLWAWFHALAGKVFQGLRNLERADNIEQAISHHQLALEVFTHAAFPKEWEMTQYNLAVAYSDRIRGERADNLEQAIFHAHQSSEVFPPEGIYTKEYVMTQLILADAYSVRIRGKRADNLEQAITHYQVALNGLNRSSSLPPFKEWAMAQNGLANAYSNRIRGERADNLEKAIRHFQMALEVFTRAAFPEEWATTQNGLANAYRERIRGERADNTEQAIAHYQSALEVFTRAAFPEQWANTQNTLALTYRNRIRGELADNLLQALAHYRSALEVFTRKAFPEKFIVIMTDLSNVLLSIAQWSEALAFLQAAIETNEELLQQISFTPEERQRLVKQAEDLFANAIWAAIQQKDFTEALHFLEWGKTRLLRQNLAIDGINLQKLSPDQRTQLQELNSKVNGLEIQLQDRQLNKFPTLQEEMLEKQTQQQKEAILAPLRADLKEKRQQLREQLQQSNVSTAIQAPPVTELYQWLNSLPQGSVLVAPIFTDFGTVVFLLPAGMTTITAQHILVLPQFSRKDLRTATRGTEQDPTKGCVNAYILWNWETDKAAREQKRQTWQTRLNATLEQLRTAVMQPILAKLTELRISAGAHLFWMPDSDSSLLPMHAIIIEQQPLLMRYTVHFIPSLYSGYLAQQRLAKITDESLLALINPTENLPFTPIEGEIITSFFLNKTTTLQGQAGTYAQLTQALTKKPTYLHLSTHGRYDWATPLESGLALANGERLTLKNLVADITLEGNRLTVLSACETGITDIKMPTEALGLPAAFLQAGVPGVISTLWTVSDLSTTFLLGKFYELHRQQRIEPAQALAQAQEWLRTATYRELQNWLSAHLPERTSPQFIRTMQLLTELRQLSAQKAEERPYTDAYYWAAFIYTGG